MPHIEPKRYAVVSCHVERPLDDRTWEAFARIQAQRPGGFAIAALIRPPDQDAGEAEEPWLERVREASGPLGHHTHWTSPSHARPTGGDPAERVRREGAWLREHGLEATLFCGGGWYTDDAVRAVVAELGYADCTPREGAPRRDGDLVELPTTRSLGQLARGVLGRLDEPVVHAYFHDYDLLDARRRHALVWALRVLARRREPTDLDFLREAFAR
jgi:hypothetical protein